jgi:hypothetical protein
MHSESAAPIRAVILGNDAVLAAFPAEPIQLARACLESGFDFVAPVSWGEEFLAERVGVAEALRRRVTRSPCIASVSPPVATARYLRAAMPASTLHVTYAGACPGASAPDIDERLLPDMLLARLNDAGIDVQRAPRHFDGTIPPDRSRYASVAGGVPESSWLSRRAGASCLEATALTADAAAALRPDEVVVMDLGPACGCTCARDRDFGRRLEPPRSPTAVVVPMQLRLADGRLLPTSRLIDIELPEPADSGVAASLETRMAELRATFLERGLSDVDVLRPVEPLASERFSASLEPWTAVTDRPTPPPDVQSPMETVSPADVRSASRRVAVLTPPYSGRPIAPRQ